MNSDTDAIDKKKGEDQENSTESATEKIKSFLKTIGGKVLSIIIYFSLGGLILFSCKVAQSNILPTDENCAPYTSQQPTFKLPASKNLINIFKSSFFDPESSEKIYFSYDENAKNTLLELLRSYKEKPNSGSIGNYFVSYFEKLTAFLFYFVSLLLSFVNRLPESLIIMLGPIAFLFVYPFVFFVGLVYSVILWFTEMTWFFKTNTNDTDEGGPKFEDVNGLKQNALAWFLVFVFAWGAFFLFTLQGYTMIVMTILLFVGGVILSTVGNMNEKSISVLSVIKDVFRYYKVVITVIISIFVVLNAFGILGNVPGFFSLVTVGLIFFGIIGMNIYQPIEETSLSPLVSDDQFVKLCSLPKREKKSTSFWTSLFSGGGKELVKDIKKISKQLKKK